VQRERRPRRAAGSAALLRATSPAAPLICSSVPQQQNGFAAPSVCSLQRPRPSLPISGRSQGRGVPPRGTPREGTVAPATTATRAAVPTARRRQRPQLPGERLQHGALQRTRDPQARPTSTRDRTRREAKGEHFPHGAGRCAAWQAATGTAPRPGLQPPPCAPPGQQPCPQPCHRSKGRLVPLSHYFECQARR